MLTLFVLAIGWLFIQPEPRNFEECVLDRMSAPASEASSIGSLRLCSERYPDRFDSSSKGTGVKTLISGYNGPYECMEDKAKNARNKVAEQAIGKACMHLYEKPSSKKKPAGPWEKHQK